MVVCFCKLRSKRKHTETHWWPNMGSPSSRPPYSESESAQPFVWGVQCSVFEPQNGEIDIPNDSLPLVCESWIHRHFCQIYLSCYTLFLAGSMGRLEEDRMFAGCDLGSWRPGGYAGAASRSSDQDLPTESLDRDHPHRCLRNKED